MKIIGKFSNGASPRALCLAVTLLFLQITSWSQVHLDIIEKSNTRNFKKIVAAVEEYYKDKDKGQGSGYKQFKRWEEFNKYHLDSKGDIQNVAELNFKEIYEYNLRLARKDGARTDAFQGNWLAFGPTSYVNAGGWNGGIGRVNTVVVDPANSNIIYAGTPAGGLWRSVAGGNSWASLTDGISSLGVSGIAIDATSPATNRTLYILTGDGDGGDTRSIGVLKSINNGATWQSTGLTWPVTSGVRGYKLSIHPTNNQILLAATTNGLYRTINGGVSWTQVLTGTIYDIEFKPGTPQTVYVTGSGTFSRSLDGGATWTAIATGATSGRLAIAVTPANVNYIYLLQGTVPATGQFGGVYRSINSGTSFTLRSNTPNVLGYSTTGNDASSQAWYDLGIAASPSNAEEVHTAGISAWKSTNGGTTLTYTSNWYEPGAGAGNYTHADIHALEFYGNTIYCGSDGGVTRSTNNAADWVTLWNGLQILQPYRISVDATNPNKIICGTQDNGSNRFEGGAFYHEQGADGMDCAIDQTNTNTFYTSIQYGSFSRTTDNGANFTGITPSGQSGNWVTPFVISPVTNTTVYVGYANLYRSLNQGTTWTNISNGLIGAGNIDQLAVANASIIFVSKGTTLYKTTNGGTSWATVNVGLPATQSISRILIDPTNSNNVWVSYGGYTAGTKVYRSTNGGTSWTNISGTLPNIPAHSLAFKSTAPTKLFVGTDVGVYVLEAAAPNWVAFNNTLPNVIIQDLEIRGTTLYAATFGRGVWRTQIDNCISTLSFSGTQSGTHSFEATSTIFSSASIANGSTIKYKAGAKVTLSPGFRVTSNTTTSFKAAIGPCGSAFRDEAVELTGIYTGPMEGVRFTESDAMSTEADALEQLVVFPNPTVGVTTMEYYLPNDAEVSITVIDATGKTVKALMNSVSHTKGKYVTTLDASGLNSGLYVCRLIYGNKVVSTKLEVK